MRRRKSFSKHPKDASAIKAYRAFVSSTAPPPSTDTPKIIAIKSDGKNVTHEWAGVATLQAADEVTGPWADVAGGASGKAIAITGIRKFYRLKR